VELVDLLKTGKKKANVFLSHHQPYLRTKMSTTIHRCFERTSLIFSSFRAASIED
jgi:hypothetical protein